MKTMSKMWLRLSKTSLLILILVAVSCTKNKLPEMKKGNYKITDIRTSTDGTSLTLYSIGVGPYEYKNGSRILFKVDSSGTIITHEYNQLYQKSVSSVYEGSFSNETTYNIVDYKISKTELIVDRIPLDESYNSKITYKYIE